MRRIILLFICMMSFFSLHADEQAIEEAHTPSPVEQTAETLADPSTYESTLFKMLLTLGGLLALVLLTVWALKKLSHGRLGGFGTQKKIMILERKPISPKTFLYYIELEGKKILIAESQLEVRMISESSPEEDF